MVSPKNVKQPPPEQFRVKMASVPLIRFAMQNVGKTARKQNFLTKLHINLEKHEKIPLENIQTNPVETAPRNCRFLSLVVVECILNFGCRNYIAFFKRMRLFLLTIGSFLLTMELFYLQLTILVFFCLQLELFCLQFLAFLLTVGAFLLTVGKCV